MKRERSVDESFGLTLYDDRDCNTCKHFEPLTGVCSVHKTEVDPCDEACEKWEDWDDA